MSSMAEKVTVKRKLDEIDKQAIRDQLADGTQKAQIAAELEVTMKQIDAIQAHLTMAKRRKKLTNEEMLRRAHSYARARARSKGLRCLTLADCKSMWSEQRGRCCISGVPFSDLQVSTSAKILSRPWRPSLDRINSRRRYEKRNVRLVAQIVNFGMGEWPLNTFQEMCRRVVSRASGLNQAPRAPSPSRSSGASVTARSASSRRAPIR